MKPIFEAWCIQILVTQHCHKKCAHCSQGVRHFANPQHASLELIEKGLQSLESWQKVVGCFGGEPTLHPEFEDICKLYQKYVPWHRAGLWTSGGPKYKKYEKLIKETFRILLYNDHSEIGKHQPLMVAIEECIPDENLRNELIDNCWLQKMWSPVINHKGAFFCEVAGMFDMLFDGPGGYSLDEKWWVKDVDEFQNQVKEYCRYCSIPIPMPHIKTSCEVDYVSPKNMERLKLAQSPWVQKGKVVLQDTIFTREDISKSLRDFEYAPWEYLGGEGIRDKNNKIGRGYAKKRVHLPFGNAHGCAKG